MNRLTGKVAIVTGASVGLGKSAAVLFAREGAKVVIAARRDELGESVVDEIRELGGEAIFVKTDVSKSEDCRNLVSRTIEKFGKLDIAFNNAGIFSFGKTVAELSEDEWDQVLSINLTGVFLSMKYQIQAMLKGGGGSIVNMSSVAGLVGCNGGLTVYNATKHGVVGLTKAAALDFATRNIRVNAVCPGILPTDMANEWFEAVDPAILQAMHPVQRFGKPEEVAETVLFLASDMAPFITGAAVPIDGAWTTQ
ncbi:SDR family oxidoreductase [Paraburkholderia humisilvae]|uniref:Dihydroanticapsin 7-dehydrogenase n=1 Tax=Paraburkholderia humisilvae TaxID=627669 RepID=A0A6J5ECU0_9BURK|nr:SDR family oxidoreductase [Paraburkholderia humisilvae]CAB3764430.1 Dihydroanticapsin 7-dehydrogenase [Paraburkholderia humisilvae]